jgi:hypothetical protein
MTKSLTRKNQVRSDIVGTDISTRRLEESKSYSYGDKGQMRQQLTDGGISHKNRFWVEMVLPEIIEQELQFAGKQVERALSMRCMSTQIPPKTIASTESKISGFVQKVPYGRIFDDVSMTYIVDRDMDLKRVFDTWQDIIAPNTHEHVAYLDDVTTNIKIFTLNRADVPSYAVTINQAYPISVAALEYSHEDNDTYQALNVTWTFKTVTYDDRPAVIDILEPDIPESVINEGFNIASLFDFLNEIASFSLQGEALKWYAKLNQYLRKYTGGYGIQGMRQLVARIQNSVVKNMRFTTDNREKIQSALQKLKLKL